MDFLDTGLLGVILATMIYLVKKTTTLCHDVEKLKKSEQGFTPSQ